MTGLAEPRTLFLSPLAQEALGPSPVIGTPVVFDPDRDDEDRLRVLAEGADVIVCIGQQRLDAARMDLCPDLRLIAVLGAGYDGVDVNAARARGIAVSNTGGNNAVDVAEFAVALWLGARRGLVTGDRLVRSGAWTDLRRPFAHAAGIDRIGVAGLGAIGMDIARRAAAWGCEVAWWSRSARAGAPWPRMASLQALAEWADTLFIALPGGADTRHAVDARVMAALGPRGLLVNVGRGSVVDTGALGAALREGRLGAAALDVHENEPLGGQMLADLDNVVLSPHVGGATFESMARLRAMTLESIQALRGGGPIPHRIA